MKISMETENAKWFLVYTKAREEKRAKKNLENQGFKTFLPILSFVNLNQPNLSTIGIMFPRYLFIKINIEKDNWTHVRSTKGVSHLITFSNKPAEVPSEVIQLIKKRTDKNGIFRQNITLLDYKKGDKVKIKKGIMKGREAIFLSQKSQDRVRVLLDIISQKTTVELLTSDIGRKETIEAFKL